MAFEKLTSSSGGKFLQEAWENLSNTYNLTKNALPENRRELVKASLQLLPFLLEAKKEEMLAEDAETEALELKVENKQQFEEGWSRAISKVNNVARAYQRLIEAQNKSAIDLTPEQRAVWSESL